MAVVYVVEDQEAVASGMARVLSKAGHAPRVFRDGLEAYSAIFETPPDLLVLDVMLPSLQGVALARLVKMNEDLRHIPLLMVSSVSDEVATQAAEAEVDAILGKPFEVEAFLNAAERLLGVSASMTSEALGMAAEADETVRSAGRRGGKG